MKLDERFRNGCLAPYSDFRNLVCYLPDEINKCVVCGADTSWVLTTTLAPVCSDTCIHTVAKQSGQQGKRPCRVTATCKKDSRQDTWDGTFHVWGQFKQGLDSPWLPVALIEDLEGHVHYVWPDDFTFSNPKPPAPLSQEKCPNCECIHCGERFAVGMYEHLRKCQKNLERSADLH